MKHRPWDYLPLLTGCSFLVSCAQFTIYVNFPPAEIQKAAEKIEGEVRKGQPAPAGSQPQTYYRRTFFLPHLGFQAADAQSVNLNVSTPGIRQKVETRKARYPRLRPYLASGAIGEGKDGLLVIRNLGGLAGAEKVKLRRLVQSENRDREDLFKEFARANNIAATAVKKPFADAIRAKMEPGQWYQDETGAWKQK